MEDNEEESGEAAAAPAGQQQRGRAAALNVLGRVVVGAARFIDSTEDMLLARPIHFFSQGV